MLIITKNKINFLLLSLIVPGYYFLTNPGKVVVITLFSYVLVFVFIFKFLMQYKLKNENLFKTLLLYGLIIVFRGLYFADSKEDYGSIILEIIPVLLIIPFSYLLGKNIYFSGYVIRILIKYTALIAVFPLIVFFLKKSNYDGAIMIRAISPFYFLILIFFKLKFKERMSLIAIIILTILMAPDHRSNLLNITISILILLISRLNPWGLKYFGKRIWFILLIFPFFFIYSKFQKDGFNFSNDTVVDSRSSIYNDVYFALNKNNDFLFGLGPVKIPTVLSESTFNEKAIYDEGRNASESLILNYLHWGGVVFVLLFSFFVIKAVYLLLFKSKSTLASMLAFFLLFRFLYGLVEFRLGYDLSSFFYYFVIGLGYNSQFRKMNNEQIDRFLKY